MFCRLCPVRANTDQPFTPSYHEEENVLLNCAIYGRVPDGLGREYTKQLEDRCRMDKGRKMLYAQNYYTEDTFWGIHDKAMYDKLRILYNADGSFPDVYEKTCSPIPEKSRSLAEAIASLFL
jgi:hypothetical protein